ncbi:protein FAM81B [Arapaima gigas]
MSQETALQHYHSHTGKSGSLEGRLPSQEQAMGALLEQAFQIKDDITASLHATQSSMQMETFSRRLLENHIQTITHIVKKLSQNIEVLESHIIQRDDVSSKTSIALQFLDHKNLAGIGDLRGRVARCDAGISQLSAQLSACTKEIRSLQQEVIQVRASVELQLKEMELKLSQVEGKLDAAKLEHGSRLKDTCRAMHKDLQLLDVKASSGLKEVSEQTERLRQWTERELRSSVDAHTQASAEMRTLLHDGMKEMEMKVQELLGPLQSWVGRLHDRVQQDHRDRKLRPSEDKLSTKVSALEKSLREELELIKDEYRAGFRSVCDAISSLSHITDTKALLDKGKLQRDIKQIHRKLVELKMME